MSIIQDIRDKYARISVIAIALALIGFILTDYVKGRDRAKGAGETRTIGSVNGRSISLDEFEKSVEQAKANYKQRGYPDEAAKQQAVEDSWNQSVNKILLTEEFERLGIQIGKRERGEVLYGPNAPDEIKRAGTDENGQYDPIKAKQAVDQYMKNNAVDPAEKVAFNDRIDIYELQRKYEKYKSLFANSINFPRWFVEKQTTDNSLLGKISVVNVSYYDSSLLTNKINISDKEIEEYINKHKEDYKQEETRSINYVSFSAAPTVSDSAKIKETVALHKVEFDTTKDVETFLAQNGSPGTLKYLKATGLPPIDKDSIIKLAKNQVFGPYIEGNNYVLAKMLDSKELPDTVKCRHILLGLKDRNGKKLMEEPEAKRIADSIEMLIKTKGGNFDSLEAKFSTDKESHKEKGVMKFSSAEIQGENFAKEFAKFILFDGKPGQEKVVKTDFGWHYIEILSYIKPETHYKVAYLKEEIVASQQTDGAVQQAAANFSAQSNGPKSFDTAALKAKGLEKAEAANIKRTDAMIPGLGYSRSLVKKIYAAKSGEVLQPEPVNQGNYKNYVVAVITEVLDKGTQSVVKARPYIEPILINKKRAEILKQKVGKITTLEAAATALGKPIVTIDSIRMKPEPGAKLGNEPKVMGAIFNPSNKGKVVPELLEGINGVYVIRVENVSATSAETGSVADQQKKMIDEAKRASDNKDMTTPLKKAASVKDNRADTNY
jgi:peptidyl-prolyl cis-trans isomerase D